MCYRVLSCADPTLVMNSTGSLRSELRRPTGQAMTARPSRLRTIARSIVSSAVSAIDRSEVLTTSFCSGYMTVPADFTKVGSVDFTAAEKNAIGKLSPRKTTPFVGRQPGDYSHWSSEPSGPWQPVSPKPVVEARYDHFSDRRFRHACTFLRFRPEKAPADCSLEQQSGLVSFDALLANCLAERSNSAP
jgi:hypothetical protein